MTKNRNLWALVKTTNGRVWRKIANPQPPQPPQQPAPPQPPANPTQLDQWFQTATDADVDNLVQTIQNVPIDEAQQNTDVQRFFNWLGWADKTPTVLTEKQWQQQRAADGNPTVLYHNDSPAGGVDSTEFAQQFMGNRVDANGNVQRHFASAGIYGDGTYFSPTASTSADGYGNNMFRGYLNSNARVISGSAAKSGALQQMQSGTPLGRFLSSIKGAYLGSRNGGGSSVTTVYAAIKGYNVVDGGWSVAVADRSVLTMSSKQKHTSNASSSHWRYMKNW